MLAGSSVSTGPSDSGIQVTHVLRDHTPGLHFGLAHGSEPYPWSAIQNPFSLRMILIILKSLSLLTFQRNFKYDMTPCSNWSMLSPSSVEKDAEQQNCDPSWGSIHFTVIFERRGSFTMNHLSLPQKHGREDEQAWGIGSPDSAQGVLSSPFL